MDKFRTFWMVLGSGQPTYRHYSRQLAEEEAERLAKVNPHTEFVVLESVSSVRKSNVVWRTAEQGEDIPF